MINTVKLSILTIVSCFVLVSCAQRYSNIPRVHHNPKHKTFKSNGHYVKVSPANTISTGQFYSEEEAIDSLKPLTFSSNKEPIKSVFSRIPEEVKPLQRFLQIDSVPSRDTLQKDEVDKSLIKGSTGLFVVATGMNAAFLLTPAYNFMFIGLLIGLGLLVIGYFISKFIQNTGDNRIFPVKYRAKRRNDRSKLKKAFNLLMIISASSFMLALLTALAGSWDAPIFFFILGLVTLYAGLIVGLIYLLMGL